MVAANKVVNIHVEAIIKPVKVKKVEKIVEKIVEHVVYPDKAILHKKTKIGVVQIEGTEALKHEIERLKQQILEVQIENRAKDEAID